MNSNMIAQEINLNIQNHLNVNENDLPPWNLTFEIFNKSFSNVFQLRKKQELGYFMILNDGGKEIRFACRKEHYYKIYILLYTILYTIIYYKLYTRLYTIKILVFLI